MRFLLAAALAGLGMTCVLAQVAAPVVPAGAKIKAELRTKLDTAHSKVGQAVQAVTTADVKQNRQKILPKGSKLSGQITAVTAAESAKSPAQITIRFTQATTKKGIVLPLDVVITEVRRIAPPAPPTFVPAMPPQPREQEAERPGMQNATLGSMPVPSQVTGSNGRMDQMEQQSVLHPIGIRATPKGSELISVGNFTLPRGTQLELRESGSGRP